MTTSNNIINQMVTEDQEENDPWSYSFPPSTESLPILQQQPGSRKSTEEKNNINGSGVSSSNLPNTDSTITGPSQLKLKVDMKKSNKSSLSFSSTMQKSVPLDPLTTKEDANSVISKDSKANSLDDDSQKAGKPKFMKDLKEFESSSKVPTSPSTSDEQKLMPSPQIIAYRKSKRTVSEGMYDSVLESSPTSPPAAKFDTKLYVDEFYKDSKFRYATMKRNIDFHKSFRSLDLTDRLIDDFACALSREILLQGRIYLSESYVCFNSNLLGWVTNLVIQMKNIVKIEKRSTAGLFPNAISIETEDGNIHTFASFLSRDQTYELLMTLWKGVTGKTDSDLGIDQSNISEDEVNNNKLNDGECSPGTQIESYILSLDGDDTNDDDNDDDEDDDDDDDEDEDDDEEKEKDYVSNGLIKKKSMNGGINGTTKSETLVETKLVKLKPESIYRSKGPDSHRPTTAAYEKLDEEKEIADEVFDAPMGVVFAILFGPETKFQRDFLESHDGSEISEFAEFHPAENDPAILERNFVYRRALGYSIGPKSTKCEVTETIEHLNFADYIIVVSTTATPDVPLGGVFTVKTRYVFTWGNDNKTNLMIYHHVEWTGRSWMKSVIEKLCYSGLLSITTEMMKELKDEIKAQTYFIDGPPAVVKLPSKRKQKKPEAEKKQEVVVKVEKPEFNLAEYLRQNISRVVTIMFTIIMVILYLQIGLFGVMKETNMLVKTQLMLTIQIAELQQDKLEIKDNEFWDMVNDKLGKKLSSLEKLQFLTYQLQTIHKKQTDSTYKDIKNLVGKIPKYVQGLL